MISFNNVFLYIVSSFLYLEPFKIIEKEGKGSVFVGHLCVVI